MRPLTADDARASLVNATDTDRRLFEVPTAFLVHDWDHTDFTGFQHPHDAHRPFLFVEFDDRVYGVVLRPASGNSRARAGLCDICHLMQPGDQVTMMTARRAGAAGARGDSVGAYMCRDLSCHDNVRLAHPLAPGEVRGSVDHRIDGTRARAEAFVRRVVADS
ncbi:FBP domain-containing protein [Microbacterium gorillae]|uniref:FBP domain-containing protein n=1 Tax=Microbacterium gorillae TaxID=1231063 RepID=UPI00058AC2BE|nr:FBP domain-containing protein [Microbacterium gorillae]